MSELENFLRDELGFWASAALGDPIRSPAYDLYERLFLLDFTFEDSMHRWIDEFAPFAYDFYHQSECCETFALVCAKAYNYASLDVRTNLGVLELKL